MSTTCRTLIILLLLNLHLPFKGNGQIVFSDFFQEGALRIDYYLGGGSQSQNFYFKELRAEPYWSGSPQSTFDTLGLGGYRVVVRHRESGSIIFTQGFSTLFQEYVTTPQATTVQRAFEGSSRIPFPIHAVVVTFEYRLPNGSFEILSEVDVDPHSPFIRRGVKPNYPVNKLVSTGPYPERFDLVLIAEGYTAEQMGNFRSDAKGVVEFLLATYPFSKLRDSINIWLIESPSLSMGVTNPLTGSWPSTVLESSFFTFGIDRYLTTSRFHALNNVAASAPGDAVVVIVNSDEYGGGGIYNHFSMVTASHQYSNHVFIHELGHSLGGLADEYYTGEVAYQDFYPLGVEPWEPNITTLVNFSSKWQDMLSPSTPIPTPPYPPYTHSLGVFEGAGYSITGIYRPFHTCVMKSLNTKEFCPVCQRAIERVLRGFLGH